MYKFEKGYIQKWNFTYTRQNFGSVKKNPIGNKYYLSMFYYWFLIGHNIKLIQ